MFANKNKKNKSAIFKLTFMQPFKFSLIAQFSPEPDAQFFDRAFIAHW